MLYLQRFLSIIIIALITCTLHAQVDADIVVALDGSGDFTKIQDAIDAVGSNSERTTIIYIKRGLYNTEKLIVPDEKKNISLIGESRDETIISYHIYDCSEGKCPVEDAALWTGNNILSSATLTVRGEGFKAENLTIQNTAGPVGQAQAITVQADKVVFVNCNLLGYQDTIFLWEIGIRSYFKNCLIVGRTDYIYGSGIGYFQSCEIRSWGGGWITAPATPLDQKYGFVFNQCDVTYAEDSPRNGDDGNYIRFGRPWHEYPKVSWLYCDMTEKIHPEGWGDTWSMEYAATSDNLELYEYKNTGEGADMSNRANWAGIKALTDDKANNYTAQVVLSGDDNWDPTQEAASITTYEWTGDGDAANWFDTNNWTPKGVPVSGEAAYVSIEDTIVADTGSFEADLAINESATLMVAGNCNVNYMSFKGAEILTNGNYTLNGKIATKDTITFNINDTLTIEANLVNIHKLIKTGSGKLILSGNNKSYSGDITIQTGMLEGKAENSLGIGNVTVLNGASLMISNNSAFQPTSQLIIETGAKLQLNAVITTSEFYVDGVIMGAGTYNATTNPELISGEGYVLVGRPSEFQFIGGNNGNWDEPLHFQPSLMPEAGELVICNKEIETTSTIFEANIHLKSPGDIRMRGQHTCTGTITMEEGTSFQYFTSGAGFSLTAPIVLNGNVKMIMASAVEEGCTLTLGGPISGDYTLTSLNNGRGTVNTGTVVLLGDNTGFTGTWDITSKSQNYPNDSYVSAIDGQSENAFGHGIINVDNGNKVIFSHARCVGDTLTMTLENGAKAELNVQLQLTSLKINNEDFESGTYSETTHPNYFTGTGTITVNKPATTISKVSPHPELKIEGNTIIMQGTHTEVEIYSTKGVKVIHEVNKKQINLATQKKGLYIIVYKIDGKQGSKKFLKL